MRKDIQRIVDTNVFNIFTDVSKEYGLTTGDIAPELDERLYQLKNELGDLVANYVEGNSNA
jgi:hypothetical protein